MTRRPRVSVVMPMRNAAPFVRAAVESILGQDADLPFEIVIVNDASEDASEETVRSIGDERIVVVQGGGRGEALAVNLAVERSRGSVVMRCDADDLWPADRMGWQTRFLDERPEFCAVAGSMWTTDEVAAETHPLGGDAPSEEITSELLGGQTRTSLCAFAVRRDAFLRTGGCRAFFRTAPDIDLQFRLAQVGRIWFESRRCYIYRIHGASVTHRQAALLRDFYETTARELAAERLRTGTDRLMRGEPIALPAIDGAPAASAADELLGQLVGAGWRAHASGDRREAVRLGWRALQRGGWRFALVRNLVALSLKPIPRDPRTN